MRSDMAGTFDTSFRLRSRDFLLSHGTVALSRAKVKDTVG